jgi:phosphatidylglycerol:prolipoprotein diacylglycerol transferase
LPEFNPIALQLGPLAIRWYALAYLAGFVLGWLYAIWLVRPTTMARAFGPDAQHRLNRAAIDDFVTWAVIGVIVGGRLGYVLFYSLPYYAAHPLEALMVWRGGMAFHGGALGAVLAVWLFCRRRGINPLVFGDVIATVAPIGLFFGRIANFVNGELFGRHTNVSWGVIFPVGGPLPRHPSQLYEAVLEGAVLFAIMAWLASRPAIRAHPGVLTGVFVAGYGIFRTIVEIYREPDLQLGFLIAEMTMGQLLSLPMILIGTVLVWRSVARLDRHNQRSGP